MRTVTLGDMTIDKIVETDVALPMSAMFPAIESADLAKLKQWFWDEDLSLDVSEAGCGLSMHSYLLRIAGKTVLIDTCNGNHKDRSMPFMHRLNTSWLDRLREQGVEPEDVDLVMCTHLHVDHVGWNTRLEGDRWVPTFPNARYVLGKRDLDFFSRPGSDDLQHPAYLDSVLPVIETGQADIVDGAKVILGQVDDGIWVQPAYGHSPGCHTVHARKGGPKAIFCGDVLHHPVQLIRPDAHFVYDYDGDMAVQSRAALIRDVINTDTLVLPAHFRFGSAGYVRGEEGALRFELLERR